ncbi:MAG: DUF4255 domain-containing protein [Spirulina sp.]
MLYFALKFLEDRLNTYLLTRTDLTEKGVNMTRLVDDEGKSAIKQNTIGASIINIEEERIFKAQTSEYVYKNRDHTVLDPELKINLYAIFAANFTFYDQALKYISYVLMFFQSHPVFTREQYPDLDPRIEKLTVELQSLNYEQLNQIWTFIGGKQLPSVVYKVRMVSLRDDTPKNIQPALAQIDTNLHGQ